MIDIDWGLRVSDILTIGGFVVGGIAVAVNIRGDVRRQGEVLKEMRSEHYEALKSIEAKRSASDAAHGLRFDGLEKELKQIADATVAIARQDERMNALDHRLSLVEQELHAARRVAHNPVV